MLGFANSTFSLLCRVVGVTCWVPELQPLSGMTISVEHKYFGHDLANPDLPAFTHFGPNRHVYLLGLVVSK